MATKLALSLERLGRRFYLKRKAAPERLLVARIPCLLAFCCISVALPSSNAPQLPWSRSGSGSSAACTSWRLSLRARICFQPQFRNDYVLQQERIAIKDLLEYVLRPPDEVTAGRPGHTRQQVTRLDPARRWWDIDFLPFRDFLPSRRGRATPLISSATGAARPQSGGRAGTLDSTAAPARL